MLETLLRKHLPTVEAWVYGSRINGRAHECSDLDLVLRAPDLQSIPADALVNFTEAVQDSTIPIIVEVSDWTSLPENYHKEIERDYVVLRKGR